MLSDFLPETIRAKLAEFERECRRGDSAMKLLSEPRSPGLEEFRRAAVALSNIFATEAEATTDEAVSAEIDKAIGHLKRATYDAYDATILSYLEKCESFIYEYRFTTVVTILPSFSDEKSQIDALKDELGKENRDSDKDKEERRDEYVERKEQQCLLVKGISQKWERYRSELNKERKKMIFTYLSWIFGILIAIFVPSIIAWFK